MILSLTYKGTSGEKGEKGETGFPGKPTFKNSGQYLLFENELPLKFNNDGETIISNLNNNYVYTEGGEFLKKFILDQGFESGRPLYIDTTNLTTLSILCTFCTSENTENTVNEITNKISNTTCENPCPSGSLPYYYNYDDSDNHLNEVLDPGKVYILFLIENKIKIFSSVTNL